MSTIASKPAVPSPGLLDSIESLTLREIATKLTGPQCLDVLTTLGPAELDALRIRTQHSMRILRRVSGFPSLLGTGGSLLTGFGIVILTGQLISTEQLPWLVVSAFVALGSLWPAAIGWCLIHHYNAERLTPLLVPLAETPTGCRDAWELVTAYPVCSRYRDTIVANGRELVAADVGMMAKLRQARDTNEEMCRALHGFAG